MKIEVKNLTECPNGTHKHVTVSVDGGPEETWSFGPEELDSAANSLPPRLMFLTLLRAEFSEKKLSKVTLAKLRQQLDARTLET